MYFTRARHLEIYLCVCIFAICLLKVCYTEYMHYESMVGIEAFRQGELLDPEKNAKALIKALYGRRVTFRRETGDATNFVARYYCGNVCIDACADGSVRYLCDIRAVDGKDPLLAWLFADGDMQIERSEKEFGMEHYAVRGSTCYAEINIHSETGRVFAARITFDS